MRLSMPWLPWLIITTFDCPGAANRKPLPSILLQVKDWPVQATLGQLTFSACSGFADCADAAPAVTSRTAARTPARLLTPGLSLERARLDLVPVQERIEVRAV